MAYEYKELTYQVRWYGAGPVTAWSDDSLAYETRSYAAACKDRDWRNRRLSHAYGIVAFRDDTRVHINDDGHEVREDGEVVYPPDVPGTLRTRIVGSGTYLSTGLMSSTRDYIRSLADSLVGPATVVVGKEVLVVEPALQTLFISDDGLRSVVGPPRKIAARVDLRERQALAPDTNRWLAPRMN